jgi:hypothetical protein
MPAIAGIGVEHFIATQALAGGGGTHRQAQNAPPTRRTQTLFGQAHPPPRPHEEEREEDAGRRVLLEALEEDPTQAPSDVQTARIIRLSNRRPHTLHLRFDRIDFDRSCIDDHSIKPESVIKLGRSRRGFYSSGDTNRGRFTFTGSLQF